MRNDQSIPLRLLNKFFVLGFNIPNERSLKRIYESIFHYKLSKFDPEEIKPEIENLVKFILSVFKGIGSEEKMKSTPRKPHYLFSMKDMTRISQGISLINKLNCDSKQVFLKLIVHET